MLKHVHISPQRNRSDSISLRSSTIFSTNSSCASSLRGSPEPDTTTDTQINLPSRSSSYSSLNESATQTILKVYTACLRLDIEYKTLAVSWDATARQIVTQVLRRCKMRHRDPRLFHLSMEVRIRRADARTMLMLDDSARPAMLQACHPSGESKFHLQMKPGGLIRVHTSALQQTSQYKSLLISEQTTSDELLGLLLSCYNSVEPVEQFSLYEVCSDQEYQRKLHPDDLPLRAQMQRNQKGENCHFLIRRIRNSSRRTLRLDDENNTKVNYSMILKPMESIEISKTSNNKPLMNLESCLCKLNLQCDNNSINNLSAADINGNVILPQKCCQCNSISSSCSECNQNSTRKTYKDVAKFIIKSKPQSSNVNIDRSLVTSSTYNPVYNIREIRTTGNSFSSFGSDKKLIEIGITAGRISRRHSVAVDEIVNTNPSMGIGNYVYI